MSIFEKPLFILEMANNHQGSVEHGKRIIQEMKKVCQEYEDIFHFAMKFQYRNLDTFIRPDYKNRMDIKNVKRFHDTRLTKEQFKELKEEVKKQGFYTICTPFDEDSVDLIMEHDYDVIKVASCSFTDWPLLEKIAATGKKVIVSCAGSSEEDIENVVAFFQHRKIDMSLMHCVAEYPTVPEHLQMNQITYLKQKFPGLRIGFSTHEAPDNFEPIKFAVAKGAEIFEKHVGVPTDTITLNGYSANPEQVANWLKEAKLAFEICGIENARYESQEKEKKDLLALQRGVFAKTDLKAGEILDRQNTYFAFPREEGQVTTSNFTKYNKIVLKQNIVKDSPIDMGNVEITNSREAVWNVVKKILTVLKESHVVIPEGSELEISHHYGLENFEKYGLAMISYVNREYCKKILIVLPGQENPTHYHQEKEETFIVDFGELDILLDGKEEHLQKGDTKTVERGVKHSFSSQKGCVFEEISTTHKKQDSYYDDIEKFVSPRKTIVYITKDMLEKI